LFESTYEKSVVYFFCLSHIRPPACLERLTSDAAKIGIIFETTKEKKKNLRHMWEKGKVNASPTTHLRPTIMKYNLVSKQIDAQYLPYACHGHLMGIS
jgi:hypothetical protein